MWLPRWLLALVAAEAAVVAVILALALGLLLLPLLLVRSLLATTIATRTLGCTTVSHWRASVAARGIALRAAEVAGLSTVLACDFVSVGKVPYIIAISLTTVLRVKGRSTGESAWRLGARWRERLGRIEASLLVLAPLRVEVRKSTVG